MVALSLFNGTDTRFSTSIFVILSFLFFSLIFLIFLLLLSLTPRNLVLFGDHLCRLESTGRPVVAGAAVTVRHVAAQANEAERKIAAPVQAPHELTPTFMAQQHAAVGVDAPSKGRHGGDVLSSVGQVL